jgi:hypothetical protein
VCRILLPANISVLAVMPIRLIQRITAATDFFLCSFMKNRKHILITKQKYLLFSDNLVNHQYAGRKPGAPRSGATLPKHAFGRRSFQFVSRHAWIQTETSIVMFFSPLFTFSRFSGILIIPLQNVFPGQTGSPCP